MTESTDRNEDANVTADETDPEPTADQRRAQLPGLGYTGKFDHGDTDDDTVDEDELEVEDEVPPPAPTVQTSPPPAALPWTLGRGGE